MGVKHPEPVEEDLDDEEVDDDQIQITYNEKKGQIVLSGIAADKIRAVAKNLNRRKRVALQMFEQGFVISGEGIFMSRATDDEFRGYA
jgi:hypothetical protein